MKEFVSSVINLSFREYQKHYPCSIQNREEYYGKVYNYLTKIDDVFIKVRKDNRNRDKIMNNTKLENYNKKINDVVKIVDDIINKYVSNNAEDSNRFSIHSLKEERLYNSKTQSYNFRDLGVKYIPYQLSFPYSSDEKAYIKTVKNILKTTHEKIRALIKYFGGDFQNLRKMSCYHLTLLGWKLSSSNKTLEFIYDTSVDKTPQYI